MENPEILKIALATCAATIVCFFTAMTGSGSGLILVPLLTFLGLHPVQAIAIHKFEATFWTFTSALRYVKNKQVHTQDLLWYLLLGAFGAFLGARYIHFISDQALKLTVGVLILIVATWMLFFHKKPQEKHVALWKRFLLIFSMIGFGIYEGVFGAGNGYFIAAIFFAVVGSNELKTVGMITVQAIVWNLVAVLTHYTYGSLVLSYAIPVAIGASVGAWFGAGFAIHKGAKFVRWIIVAGSYIAGLAMLASL